MLIIKRQGVAKAFKCPLCDLFLIELLNELMLNPDGRCRNPMFDFAQLVVNDNTIDFIRAFYF